ncbi:MAG: mobile mystery protein A [Gammaproteobacteria bacterium]
MSFEAIVLKQYRDKVNQAVKQFGGYSMPVSEGWLKTVRKALGMSGAQLAKRLGVTKGRVSQAESGEVSGSVTLRTMQTMAEAMNCRFVYAVVPEKDIDSLIREQAIKQAKARVKAASTHMALEAQSLDKDTLNSEIERIASEIMGKMPSDFWSET